MTPRFQIIPAKPWHCGAMVRRLRIEHRMAVAKLGLDSHRELSDRFGQSAFRRALLIDGHLEALGGVTGSLLSGEGYVWLALSQKAMQYPLTVIKQARQQLAAVMQTKRTLITSILDGDDAAKRFAIFLGFVPADLDDAISAFSRLGRRDMLRRLETNEDARISMGSGSAVVMRYKAENEAHEGGLRMPQALRDGADFAPFIVYTAGRSRTAWLSEFLTYGKCHCFNEVAIKFRDIEQVKAFFSTPGIGSAETAVAPGWQLINHLVPRIKSVVVNRPLEEIIESFGRVAPIDEEKLRHIIAYEIRCMEKISQQPNVLTVNFRDLTKPDVCAAIFEHCTPYRFDYDWWLSLSDKNIQSDVSDIFGYYQSNREKIEGFKRLCKRQMISLVRSGQLRAEA